MILPALLFLTAVIIIIFVIIILTPLIRRHISLSLLNDPHHVRLELWILDLAATILVVACARFHVGNQLLPLVIANVDFFGSSYRSKGLLELPGADSA